MFFLSSCANSCIGDNVTHLWRHADNVKNLCRCRQVRTDPNSLVVKTITFLVLRESATAYIIAPHNCVGLSLDTISKLTLEWDTFWHDKWTLVYPVCSTNESDGDVTWFWIVRTLVTLVVVIDSNHGTYEWSPLPFSALYRAVIQPIPCSGMKALVNG